MKKLSFLTSMVALTFAVPAMAVPSNTSSTFPANGKMLEDYTYQNQATVTNLKVAEGTATTTANYDNCPSGYPNSDDGATSTDQCYKACTLSDFPANSHIASVTGKNYSGANVTDTCAIASCDTGYTLNNGACNANVIQITWADASAEDIAANEAGTVTYGGDIRTPRKAVHKPGKIFTGWTFNAPVQTYDFSTLDADEETDDATFDLSNMTWTTNFSYGDVSGVALCSATSGTEYTAGTPDESAAGGNCWCKATGYKPSGSNTTYENSSSSVWVYMFNYVSSLPECMDSCAADCAGGVRGSADFRRALFGITQ